MMKLFQVAIIISILCACVYPQILNPSFEDWSGGEPIFWNTSNYPVPAPTTANITQTSNAYEGSFAVMGEVILATDTILGGGTFDFYPGITTFGDDDVAGFPIEGRPKNFRGYYIYEPAGEDGYMSINVNLTKWVDNENGRLFVGVGSELIPNWAFLDSVYTEFLIPITYYETIDPDTVMISIGIPSGNVGSKFYVDNLSLSFLEILEPNEGEIIIAGEKDTIRWSTESENINLLYSTDNGATFTNLLSNYPSDSGKYVWDVPDSLLSAKAKIKIEDSEDNTQYDVKSVYIKPWKLTKLDDDGNFIDFRGSLDGWQFINNSTNMWPLSWWQQFNYYDGVDPNTGEGYPNREPFTSAITPDFPDWPLFVDVFGIDKCYATNPPTADSYRARATTLWNGFQKEWKGSCYGFANSSLLYFYHKNIFILQNPGVGDYQNLVLAQINNDTRRTINKYQLYASGNPYENDRVSGFKKDARQTLKELKEMFSKKDGDARTLMFYNNEGSGGHAVTPRSMRRNENNPSEFIVYVYDPNLPGVLNVVVYIDSLNNNWRETSGFGWSGTTGCFLGLESREHIFNIGFPVDSKSSLNKQNKSSGFPIMNIYNTSDAEIKISNSEGTIGYADSLAYSNITDAIPIIPIFSTHHPPIGYRIPQGNYDIELNNFSDSSSYVFVMGESTIYNYRRYDAKTNENDFISFADGLVIKNSDLSSKKINLETIIEEDNSEKVFSIENLLISSNDSINIKEKEKKELVLKNYGIDKSYDINLREVSNSGANLFSHKEIVLEDNSAHQIVPSWENLYSSGVKILIDFGNDGTIDDSIFVQNQATSTYDQGSLLSPNSYNLAQNYPNPFNPVTTIQYSIPQRSNVTLKVYDILGNEIATLVNEEKSIGVYSVSFDASGLASGIYFYKLQAGDFVQTRKMILLK